MRSRSRFRNRGFTLLEVVVSIALFALLMSIVYSGFTTAVRAYDAAEQRVGEVERMRVVSAFIRRSIGGAYALAVPVRREWILQFDGTGERLRYIADLPGYVGAGGLHELILEVERAGDQRDLVIRRRPLVVADLVEPGAKFETRILAGKVQGLKLRFFGALDERDEPVWRDDWISAKTMPLLVELAIAPANGQPWPVLQVRPQVDSIRYVNLPRSGAPEPPSEEDEVLRADEADNPDNAGGAQMPANSAQAVQ